MTFDDWFNEIEGYALRAERFYDDLDNYANPKKTVEMAMRGNQTIVSWLRAAYETGQEDAMNNKQDIIK